MRFSELTKNPAAPPLPKPAPASVKPPSPKEEDSLKLKQKLFETKKEDSVRAKEKIKEDFNEAKEMFLEAQRRRMEDQKKEEEARVREKIKQEFAAEISQASERIRGLESQLAEQKKNAEPAGAALSEAQKRIELLEKEIRESRALVSQKDQGLEREIEKRMAPLRQSIEKEMREGFEARAAKIIQDLQEQLKQKEQLLQQKEKEKLKERKEEPAAPAHIIETAPQLAGIRSAPVFPKLEIKISPQIQSFYAKLLAASAEIFGMVEKRKDFNIHSLKRLIDENLDSLVQNESDAIVLFFQAYPDEHYFSHHAVNCAFLCVVLGQEMKFSADELKNLALAALLHDIGLVTIQENLDYPKELAPEIQAEVLKHPDVGAAMVKDLAADEVLNIMRQHHETDSGKGYPAGLQGTEICLGAKILHIVDSFEAMTHERPYRKKPFEADEAIKEMIERGKGIYDRDVLKALMGSVGLYPVMSLVELSNKQIARVIGQNRRFPMSPVVRVEFDEEGRKVKDGATMDLTQNLLIHVSGPVGNKGAKSYQSEKVLHDSREPIAKRWVFTARDFIPIVLMGIILVLSLYIVFKI